MAYKSTVLLLLIVFAFNLQAQNTKTLSEKEKHALHVIHIASEAFYDYYHNFLLPGNITFNEGGDFYEQVYEIIPGGFANFPYEARNLKHFRLTKQGDNITAGHTIINCNYLYFNFQWNNDKIEVVTSGTKKWSLEYNAAGLISRISDTNYKKPGPPYKNDNRWMKLAATFEYGLQAQIVLVQKFADIGLGKSEEKVKPAYTYMTLKKSIGFDASTKTWRIELTRFKEKQTEKDGDVVENVNTITTTRDKDKIVISNIPTEAILNDVGQVVTVTMILSKDTKTTYSYDYNERGWVKMCTIKVINNDGSFRSSIASSYDYRYSGGDKNEMCSYKAIEEQKAFNAAGDVITEVKEGSYRKKNENGEWMPWQTGNIKLMVN